MGSNSIRSTVAAAILFLTVCLGHSISAAPEGLSGTAAYSGKIIIDRTPPLIDITGLEESGVYQDEARLAAFSSDSLSGLQGGVQVFVNGIPYPNHYPVSSGGAHIYRVEAEDRAGNKASRDVPVIVNKAPALTVDHWDSSFQDGRVSLTVRGSVSDVYKEDILTLYYRTEHGSRVAFKTIELNGNESASWEETIELESVPAGTYSIELVAEDLFGRMSAASPWSYKVYNRKPIVTVVTDKGQLLIGKDGILREGSNGRAIDDGTLVIEGTIVDEDEDTELEVMAEFGGQSKSAAIDGANWTLELSAADLEGLAEGRYQVTVEGADGVRGPGIETIDGSGPSRLEDIHTIVVDRTPPVYRSFELAADPNGVIVIPAYEEAPHRSLFSPNGEVDWTESPLAAVGDRLFVIGCDMANNCSDRQEIALPYLPKLIVYVNDLSRNANVADIAVLETAMENVESLDTDLRRSRLIEADSSIAALADGELQDELEQHLSGKWLEYVVHHLSDATIADLERMGVRNLVSGLLDDYRQYLLEYQSEQENPPIDALRIQSSVDLVNAIVYLNEKVENGLSAEITIADYRNAGIVELVDRYLADYTKALIDAKGEDRIGQRDIQTVVRTVNAVNKSTSPPSGGGGGGGTSNPAPTAPGNPVPGDDLGEEAGAGPVKEPAAVDDVRFADVSKAFWAYESIREAAANGWVRGCEVNGQRLFRPNAQATRAEALTIMLNGLGAVKPITSKGEGEFPDAKGKWYEAQAQLGFRLGIISGYADGTFRGENKLTRAEAIKMFAAAFDLLPSDEINLPFIDVDRNAWYADSLNALYRRGIIKGNAGNRFAPNRFITRAELVHILYPLKRLLTETDGGETDE